MREEGKTEQGYAQGAPWVVYIELKRKCMGTKGPIRWSEVSLTLGSVGAKFYCTSLLSPSHRPDSDRDDQMSNAGESRDSGFERRFLLPSARRSSSPRALHHSQRRTPGALQGTLGRHRQGNGRLFLLLRRLRDGQRVLCRARKNQGRYW